MAVDPNQRTSEHSTAELMDAWYAAWNAHELDAIAACLTEDAVLEEPGAAEGLYRGPEAILAWGARPSVPRRTFISTSSSAGSHRVAM